MSRDQALAAAEAGPRPRATRLVADGADLIALGEMGIGNTTASAAMIAALTGRPPRDVTGLGTGIDADRWERKVAIVERALARARAIAPTIRSASLAEVGGFEIGALAGAMIGGAAAGVPIVLDGLIVGAGGPAGRRALPGRPAVPDRLAPLGRAGPPDRPGAAGAGAADGPRAAARRGERRGHRAPPDPAGLPPAARDGDVRRGRRLAQGRRGRRVSTPGTL